MQLSARNNVPLSEKTPAILKAVEFVRGKLDAGTWRSGMRLSPVRVLAKNVGISQRTMVKAVVELKKMHLLFGTRGGYLRAGTPEAQAATSEPTKGFWKIKRAELERDILSGTYSEAGKLPPPKELQTRYGVAYRTMNKILHSLVDDGVVWMRGKSFELPGTDLKTSANRIVLFTPAFAFPARSALNPEEYPLIDRLEHECIRRGLRLEVLELDFADSQKVLQGLSAPAVSNQTLGFIMDVWWDPRFYAQYGLLLDKLVRWKKPIAIVDEWGEYLLPPSHGANRLVQVYRIEGAGAGAQMAKLLLTLGHRSVAYFSVAPDTTWSKDRFTGISRQFCAAGLEQKVHAFYYRETADYLDYGMSLSGYHDEFIKKVYAIGRPRDQAAERYDRYRKWKAAMPRHSFDRIDIKNLCETLAPLHDALQGTSKAKALESVNEMVMKKANACIAPMLLAPLFEQALAKQDITAWICASDITAFDALRFLDAKNINIPADLSVAGFDNIPLLTASRRLTSYDFNARSFAYRMLDFIVRPPRPRGVHRHVPIEVDGTIMTRGTTGKAKAVSQ